VSFFGKGLKPSGSPPWNGNGSNLFFGGVCKKLRPFAYIAGYDYPVEYTDGWEVLEAIGYSWLSREWIAVSVWSPGLISKLVQNMPPDLEKITI
jgi:hypothetical protein